MRESFRYVTCVARNAQALDLGARIRTAREEAGLSQVGLAEELKQGERTIQSWERNERVPRLPALMRLAVRLDKPVAYFYENGAEPKAAA